MAPPDLPKGQGALVPAWLEEQELQGALVGPLEPEEAPALGFAEWLQTAPPEEHREAHSD